MDIHAEFDAFCEKHGISDPTDRDRVFFVAGLQATLNQRPRCYGYFGQDGSVLQITDFIEPGRISRPTPLYDHPVAAVPKPDVHVSLLEHVWRSCYAPDDHIGFARWVEKYSKSMI